jgi:hypothetical protein
MALGVPDNWADYVVGLHGVTVEACKALNMLVRLPTSRVEVFHAAMRGRAWMYHYEYASAAAWHRGNGQFCAEGDYWRSVIKAVDLAANAKNCQEEIAWFLEPIPNGKSASSSPIVIAAEMETA